MLKESGKALTKCTMVGLQTGCLLFELSVFKLRGHAESFTVVSESLGAGCRGADLQVITKNYLESILLVIKYKWMFRCVI